MIDFIQGEKFRIIADYSYAPEKRSNDDFDKLVNTFSVDKIKPGDIIYTHTMYIFDLLDILHKNKFNESYLNSLIIICHNSDDPINSIKLPKVVKRLYATNVNMEDDRIESIPIGLENDRWFKHSFSKKQAMLDMLIMKDKEFKNLLYINHNVATNTKKRLAPYTLFKDVPWCTIENGKNSMYFNNYIGNVYNHKFVLCPEGNGIDTVRLWECLYMCTIPIVQNSINTDYYKDLPICFVDNWEEITEDFLINEFVRIKKGIWNMDKLKFSYWKTKITEDAKQR